MKMLATLHSLDLQSVHLITLKAAQRNEPTSRKGNPTNPNHATENKTPNKHSKARQLMYQLLATRSTCFYLENP